jgi:hypothetical protein
LLMYCLQDFNQTSDAEVVAILKKFMARNAAYREAAAAAAAAVAASAVPEAAGSSEAPTAAAAAAPRVTIAKGVGVDSAPAGEEAAADTAPVKDQDATLPAAVAAKPPEASNSEVTAAHAAALVGPTQMEVVAEEELVITDAATPGVRLHGTLNVPQGAAGLVIFAHGSGSSRRSPRNRQVAATLNEAGEVALM